MAAGAAASTTPAERGALRELVDRFARLKRFLVTGCPRSGTKYTTTLFRHLGVHVEHEKVFGVGEALGRRPHRWRVFEGDVSWLAVPFLPLHGEDEDVVVLHQLRHPLEFVRSVVGFGFLSDERADLAFPQVVRRHAPEVYEPATQPERGATMWKVWNARAEPHADITYRLEDLDADLLLELCRMIELPVTEEQVAFAIEELPKNINRRVRDESVPWEAIEPIVGEAAAHYGYEPKPQRGSLDEASAG